MVKYPQKFSTNLKKDKQGWKLKDQAQFFSLLADLLQAGFSLQQALKSMQNLMPESKKIIVNIANEILSGSKISMAMKKYISKGIYYQLMISEQHGNFDQSIKQLGELLHKRVEQKNKLNALMAYPLFLLVTLIVIVVGIKVWLNPVLGQFTEQFEQQRNFNNVKIYLQVVLMLVSIGLFCYATKVYMWWKKQETITKHHWYSQLPVIGKIYRQYSYYYLTFNLSLLLGSGMDFSKICDFLLKLDKNSLLYQLGQQITQTIYHGDELGNVIDKYPFIPQELKIYINKGETLESLSAELLIYSNIQYKKLLAQIDNLMALVQPLLFVIIAIIIVMTYLSILLPMYQTLGGLY